MLIMRIALQRELKLCVKLIHGVSKRIVLQGQSTRSQVAVGGRARATESGGGAGFRGCGVRGRWEQWRTAVSPTPRATVWAGFEK
jgi:hypothetical protein